MVGVVRWEAKKKRKKKKGEQRLGLVPAGSRAASLTIALTHI